MKLIYERLVVKRGCGTDAMAAHDVQLYQRAIGMQAGYPDCAPSEQQACTARQPDGRTPGIAQTQAHGHCVKTQFIPSL